MRTAHVALFAALVGLAAAAAVAVAPAPVRDTYLVTLDPAVRDGPATGRVILFFIRDDERRLRRQPPSSGPFYFAPQPVVSVAVTDLAPGGVVTIEAPADAFPAPIDTFDGGFRVQAVLDAEVTERSFLEEPGNAVSATVSVTLAADQRDVVELRLDRPVRPYTPERRPMPDNVRWVNLPSPSLSAFHGRPVTHHAGIALPPGYDDEANAERQWPAVYVIPGFGGRHGDIVTYAHMLRASGIGDIAPMAVYVMLDPEMPLAHHGFVDSPNVGPRGTSLVTELIPHLEATFRLAKRPEGRVVTGHSSGGWASLWLQLQFPDVFGACWSSAPDPVDFTAFQMSNLYRDDNLYVDARGEPRPSYRQFVGLDEMAPMMTVEQECRVEFAIDPLGRSGQQWDTWETMFSPRDEATGLPRPMFNARTGTIDHAVTDAWKRYDVTALVAADWPRYGPILMERVRLRCGALDSFYLQRAVAKLKTLAETRAAQGGGWQGHGFIEIVDDATHDTLIPKVFQDVNEEMRTHLREAGLHD